MFMLLRRSIHQGSMFYQYQVRQMNFLCNSPVTIRVGHLFLNEYIK